MISTWRSGRSVFLSSYDPIGSFLCGPVDSFSLYFLRFFFLLRFFLLRLFLFSLYKLYSSFSPSSYGFSSCEVLLFLSSYEASCSCCLWFLSYEVLLFFSSYEASYSCYLWFSSLFI